MEGQNVIAVIVTESRGAMVINTLKQNIYSAPKLTCGNMLPSTSEGLIIDRIQNGSITISATKENILNELILLSYCLAP